VPRVIITEGAAAGMERCRRFLTDKNPEAARRAGQAIAKQLVVLESAPFAGRPLSELPELRELVIGFGDSGFITLYRYDAAKDVVYLLAFRHQKEAGY
jgi:plasmid stabilization system protein ParE